MPEIADILAKFEATLAPDELEAVAAAVEYADADGDGVLSRDEFVSLRDAGGKLFDGLYAGPVAEGLRRTVFHELECLFDGSASVDLDRVAKRLAVFDSARAALLQEEGEAVRNGSFLNPRDESAFWSNYVVARDSFTARLDAASNLFDAGHYAEVRQNLDEAKVWLDGARRRLHGLNEEDARRAGDAAEFSKGVVVETAFTEIVLATGGLAAGALGPIVGAGAFSLSLHVGGIAALSDFSGADTKTVAPATRKETPEVVPKEPEPPRHATLRTPDELVAEAREKLRRFAGERRINLDLGRFLLEANLAEDLEANAPNFPETLKEFNARRDTNFRAASKAWGLTDASSFRNRVDALRKQFFTDGSLTAYWKGKTRLSRGLSLDALLTPGGGNCQFRNQLLAAYMLDERFPADPAWTPGVQFLPRHVQPVLYNRAENKVWDLVSGAIVTGVAGDIFHPAVLLWSYANGRGENPGTPPDDLLIAGPAEAGPDMVGVGSAVAGAARILETALDFTMMDSIFSYPKARYAPGLSAPGRIPDFAFDFFGESGEAGSVVETSGGGNGGPSWLRGLFGGDSAGAVTISEVEASAFAVKPRKTMILSYEEALPLVKDSDLTSASFGLPPRFKTLDPYAPFQALILNSSNSDLVIFPEAEQARLFESLETRKERGDYLTFLVNERLRSVLASPVGRNLRAVLDDPRRVETLSPARLETATAFTISVETMVDEAFDTALTIETIIPQDGGYFGSMPRFEDFPAVGGVKDAVRALNLDVVLRPEATLAWLNSLPSENRLAFLHLLDALSKARLDQENDRLARYALPRLVADRNRVRFSDNNQTPPPPEPPFRPRVNLPEANFNDEAIAITLIELPEEPTKPDAERQEKREKPREQEAEVPPAEIVISPQTMLDFMVWDYRHRFSRYARYGIMEIRWDEAFNGAFARLNAEGRHDDFFRQVLPVLARNHLSPSGDSSLAWKGFDPEIAEPRAVFTVITRKVEYLTTTPVRRNFTPAFRRLVADWRTRNAKLYEGMQAKPEDLQPHVWHAPVPAEARENYVTF